jgi:hypothetical protein
MGQRPEACVFVSSVTPVDHYHSLEILKDWIDLIDDDGWVAREQILGEEARSKACHPVPT